MSTKSRPLTEQLRNAFVQAVMRDVPTVDYDEIAENIARLAARAVFMNTFPSVTAEGFDALNAAGWLAENSVLLPAPLNDTEVPRPWGPDGYRNFLPAHVYADLEKVAEAKREQTETHTALRAKLVGVAKSVRTVKALHAVLPEFAHYIQDNDAPVTYPLVVVDVVDAFRAAGWPKEGKKS